MLLACAAPAGAHFERRPELHYRYVNRPPGEPRTPPPARAQVSAGPGEAVSLVTGEPLAQAVVYAPPGAFGPRPVTVTLEPRAPGGGGLRTAEPFTEVPGGTIVGNVYRLGAGAPLRASKGTEIRLRPPFEVVPEPVVARRVGGRWQALPTRLISGGVMAGPITGTGDYALVVAPGEAAADSGGGLLPALVPVLVVFVAAGAAALRARGRRAAPDSQA